MFCEFWLRQPSSLTTCRWYLNNHTMKQKEGCIFCEIVSRRSEAKVRYEDHEIIVIDNKLDWVPVMLLVMPKSHLTQEELWSNSIMARVGRVAVAMGAKLSPKGCRLLSNIGHDAMQSQEHGHVHVLGGMYLGPYA